jgi:WD40 repeat protein
VTTNQDGPTEPADEARPDPATYDVFLSHSGKDTAAVTVIYERLRQEAGLEPFFDKRHLVAGERWQEKLEEALHGSRTCAVFLGPSKLGPWENEELRAALSLQVHDSDYRVIPVLLPGSAYPSAGSLPAFLQQRTWVDFRPGLDDVDAFESLVAGIKGVVSASAPVAAGETTSPFRGLDVFDEEHASFFFGREALTQQLVEKIREERFLAVVGASGSGKSSVVRAGLIPQLRRGALPGSDSWPVAVLRPGFFPLESLSVALVPVFGGAGSAIEESGRIRELLGAEERGLHSAVATALAGTPSGRRVVLIVDQFEEVFAPEIDTDQRDKFVAGLLYASSIAGGQTIVVLTMRADFVGKATTIRGLAERIADNVVLVSAMTEAELRDAIVKPAQAVELEFERGLVDTILDDLGTSPGVLPLLQVTLQELWEGRRGRWLTTDRYHEIGGVQGAIARRADSALSRLTPPQQEAARRILLRLVRPGEGTEDARRRALLSELMPSGPGVGDVQAVIAELTNARLLTTSEEPNGDVVDITHEALIRRWKRLRDWLDEDRADLQLHRRLTDAANTWASGRDLADLYAGSRLEAAEAWAAREPEELNALEREFLDASIGRRQEQARQERRRRLTAIGIGSGVVLTILIAAIVASISYFRAEDARLAAEHSAADASARLALSQGQLVAANDPVLGVRLLAEGLRRAMDAGLDTDGFRAALLEQLSTGRIAMLRAGVSGLRFVGDGSTLLVAYKGSSGLLWDSSTGERTADLELQVEVDDFLFPPSGRSNASLFAVKVADPQGYGLRQIDGTQVDLGGYADDVRFVGASAVVVRYPTDPTAARQDSEYGGPWTAEIRSGPTASVSAAIDTFTDMSVVGGSDWSTAMFEHEGSIELVGLEDGQRVTLKTTGIVDIRPRGRVFAVRDGEGNCVIVDARSRTTSNPVAGRCGYAAASPDGSAMLYWVHEHPVELVHSTGGEPIPLPDTVRDFEFSPETGTSRLAIIDQRGVKLYDATSGKPVKDLGVFSFGDNGRAVTADRLKFSPNGKYLVIQPAGARQVFDAASGEPIDIVAPDSPTPSSLKGLDFSEDGKYAVAQFAFGNEHVDQLLDRALKPIELARPATWISLWPNGGLGPVIVAFRDGAVGLVDPSNGEPLDTIEDVSLPSFDWSASSSNRAAAHATEEIDDTENTVPSVILGIDGTASAVPGDFMSFSPDDDASSFVIRLPDGSTDLWSRTAPAAHLTSLDVGVADVQFSDDGSRLAVRYSTGRAYLIDIESLRRLAAPRSGVIPDEELLHLACLTEAGSSLLADRVSEQTGDESVACQ